MKDVSEEIFEEGMEKGMEKGSSLLSKAFRMLKEGAKETEILAAGVGEATLAEAKKLILL